MIINVFKTNKRERKKMSKIVVIENKKIEINVLMSMIMMTSINILFFHMMIEGEKNKNSKCHQITSFCQTFFFF